jgi:hypothetical protein
MIMGGISSMKNSKIDAGTVIFPNDGFDKELPVRIDNDVLQGMIREIVPPPGGPGGPRTSEQWRVYIEKMSRVPRAAVFISSIYQATRDQKDYLWTGYALELRRKKEDSFNFRTDDQVIEQIMPENMEIVLSTIPIVAR